MKPCVQTYRALWRIDTRSCIKINCSIVHGCVVTHKHSITNERAYAEKLEWQMNKIKWQKDDSSGILSRKMVGDRR